MTRAEELADGWAQRHVWKRRCPRLLIKYDKALADAEALAEALEKIANWDLGNVGQTAREALARYRGEPTREQLEQLEPDDYPFRGQP